MATSAPPIFGYYLRACRLGFHVLPGDSFGRRAMLRLSVDHDLIRADLIPERPSGRWPPALNTRTPKGKHQVWWEGDDVEHMLRLSAPLAAILDAQDQIPALGTTLWLDDAGNEARARHDHS